MKKLTFLLETLILLIINTSCLDNDNNENNTYATYSFSGYNFITDTDGNAVIKNATYTVSMNITNMTASVKVESAYTQDGTPMAFLFTDVPMTVDNEGYIIKIDDMIPQVSDGTASDYRVQQLSIKMLAYTTDGNDAYVMMQSSYRISGKYDVCSLMILPSGTPLTYLDCTTTTAGMGEPFTTTGTTYEVKITSPTTADVTLKDAQFMDKMPQQTIQLKNVPIVATTNGYRIEAAEVVPCINDVPFEKYKITNLYLSTINKAKSFNLKFNCTYSGITFKIVANANLFPKTNEK